VSRAQVTPLGRGLHRVTHPLPFPPGHVHCYALADAGGWTLVDAGLGDEQAAARWSAALAELGSPRVARIVITHFHPDHVGAAAALAALTAAEVWQAGLDRDQSLAVWGSTPLRAASHLRRHGVPQAEADMLDGASDGVRTFVGLPPAVRRVREGDCFEAGGSRWRLVHLPGHADGQHGLLEEEGGRLLAGDHVLASISPTVGVYPGSREDPLADYLSALARVRELAPSVAYSGHGEPIEDVAGCALGLDGHHARRLREHRDVLAARGASDAYAVSRAIFGDDLPPLGRRLALAEALAHLVRLAGSGLAAVLGGDDGTVLWAAAGA
jgi:glyoxylase-like metal-dependent hydrolase (beta-lactamase superfamily II)